MKNTFNMKSTLYSKFLGAAVVAVLAACSAGTPEGGKQARLEELKVQQADLSKEIKSLEAEIAKENPDAITVKSKEVVVTKIEPRSFDYFVKTQGSVEAEDNILVSAKTMGVVTTVYVTEGQQVSKGQVIAQIDNGIILRNIDGMKSQLGLAKTVYERQKNLWDQKIGTEVQYLQAKTNMEGLEKQVASMQEQNSMSRIVAPLSGFVDEVMVKIGQNISPGMPAARVVNTSELKLKANVSEAYVTDIKKGNTVVVSIPELKKDIEAKVSFVGKTIDPLSRTFVVEVKLPSDPNLRPNMTGIIKVIFKTVDDALVVPVNVVQDLNNEKIVFVAEKNGQQTIARKKVVTVDGVYDNMAHVEGVKAGDEIVSFGFQGLNDGQLIKL